MWLGGVMRLRKQVVQILHIHQQQTGSAHWMRNYASQSRRQFTSDVFPISSSKLQACAPDSPSTSCVAHWMWKSYKVKQSAWRVNWQLVRSNFTGLKMNSYRAQDSFKRLSERFYIHFNKATDPDWLLLQHTCQDGYYLQLQWRNRDASSGSSVRSARPRKH